MYGFEEEPNGSKAVSLLLRLSTLVLVLTSAVMMATASDCTVAADEHAGAAATLTLNNYKHSPPFLILIGFNITAAVLEAAAIYLQLSNGGGDEEEGFRGKLPGVLLVVIDVAVQALVYSSTGATFAAAHAYRRQLGLGACAGFGEEARRAKLLSLAASFAAGLAAVAKDVPLPFSIWPNSTD